MGRGEDGLGRHLVPPPPHRGILLFCLIFLNYMTFGVYSRCKLVPLEAVHLFDLNAAILGWLLAAVKQKKQRPWHIHFTCDLSLQLLLGSSDRLLSVDQW